MISFLFRRLFDLKKFIIELLLRVCKSFIPKLINEEPLLSHTCRPFTNFIRRLSSFSQMPIEAKNLIDAGVKLTTRGSGIRFC
jgi:hypothetical protein